DAVRVDVWLDADGMTLDALWTAVDRALAEGRRVWIGGAAFERLSRQFGVAHDGRSWLCLSPSLPRRVGAAYRLRDLLCAGMALVLCAPVLAVLAFLVKRSSPGPVFYSTTVLGEGKIPFRWYKFRSMRVRGEDQERAARRARFRAYAEGKLQGKVIDPSRVTPIGRFLRKYSLDELPQLWNVVKGQMTLVGPRPCLPYEAEVFAEWAQRRFAVRPGLTGIWQVFGRSRVSLEEGLGMDVYYTYARS